MDKLMKAILSQIQSTTPASYPAFSTTEEKQYFELCKAFPLAIIETDHHNTAALKVLAELARAEGVLNNGGITYLKTLSKLIGDFESERFKDLTETFTTGPEVLSYLIEQSTMSQSDVARAVGIERQNLSNYLHGRRALSKEVRLKLCALFNLKTDVFEYSPTRAKP
jgi:antitoxin component HigA of HigAB toxin-antitoxin module